jgi:hypothetical protein
MDFGPLVCNEAVTIETRIETHNLRTNMTRLPSLAEWFVKKFSAAKEVINSFQSCYKSANKKLENSADSLEEIACGELFFSDRAMSRFFSKNHTSYYDGFGSHRGRFPIFPHTTQDYRFVT